MVIESATSNPQTGTTLANEFAKLRRDQKLDVDKTVHTRSHLEKLQKKELRKEARNPTTRQLTVAPKWRHREHLANSGDAVKFGPDRVCQAANPRRDGPCRCTPCRQAQAQAQVQTPSILISGHKEGFVCFDKRKRVGGTAALPAVMEDRWVGEVFGAFDSESEDEGGLHATENGEEFPRSHTREVDIWDLVKPAKSSRKQKSKYSLQLS